jgi:hypothetical protein
MPKNVHQGALADLMKLLEEAGARVHRERVIKEKASLTSVMNAMTEACYQTLGGSIAAKMILASMIPPSQHGLSPEQKMAIREKVSHEILKMISIDLADRDPKNEYHVAIVKRERRDVKK